MAQITMGDHIWKPILRKVCERKLFIIVCIQENCVALWFEKLVIEEFVCRLWFESVSSMVSMAKFTMGCHMSRHILKKVCESKLFIMICVEKIHCMVA